MRSHALAVKAFLVNVAQSAVPGAHDATSGLRSTQSPASPRLQADGLHCRRATTHRRVPFAANFGLGLESSSSFGCTGPCNSKAETCRLCIVGAVPRRSNAGGVRIVNGLPSSLWEDPPLHPQRQGIQHHPAPVPAHTQQDWAAQQGVPFVPVDNTEQPSKLMAGKQLACWDIRVDPELGCIHEFAA